MAASEREDQISYGYLSMGACHRTSTNWKTIVADIKFICPECGAGVDPKGRIDKYKLYKCDRCSHQFSISGAEEKEPTEEEYN
jgi:DNA-directed RNA polymerase subunit RPC12/RpoP